MEANLGHVGLSCGIKPCWGSEPREGATGGKGSSAKGGIVMSRNGLSLTFLMVYPDGYHYCITASLRVEPLGH